MGNRGLTLSKTASTSTSPRISRMLPNRSKSKDLNHLSPLNTCARASSSFKSENNLDINQHHDRKPTGISETQMADKVIKILHT